MTKHMWSIPKTEEAGISMSVCGVRIDQLPDGDSISEVMTRVNCADCIHPDTAVCEICRQVIKRPDLRGTMWRRATASPINYSFSATVVQMAGGIDRLLSEWIQVDPHTGKPVER